MQVMKIATRVDGLKVIRSFALISLPEGSGRCVAAVELNAFISSRACR
jgi:hypothetical protein